MKNEINTISTILRDTSEVLGGEMKKGSSLKTLHTVKKCYIIALKPFLRYKLPEAGRHERAGLVRFLSATMFVVKTKKVKTESDSYLCPTRPSERVQKWFVVWSDCLIYLAVWSSDLIVIDMKLGDRHWYEVGCFVCVLIMSIFLLLALANQPSCILNVKAFELSLDRKVVVELFTWLFLPKCSIDVISSIELD